MQNNAIGKENGQNIIALRQFHAKQKLIVKYDFPKRSLMEISKHFSAMKSGRVMSHCKR
jgi:hypothetical protein